MLAPWDEDRVRPVLDLLSRRWVLGVIALLWNGPMRRVQLRRHLAAVSDKSLTETLRELERRGVVVRRHYEEIPPRVEYGLTDEGQLLGRLVIDLSRWLDERGGMA